MSNSADSAARGDAPGVPGPARPQVTGGRWLLIVPVSGPTDALADRGWVKGPLSRSIPNEPGTTTGIAWRQRHEEPTTISEVVTARWHREDPTRLGIDLPRPMIFDGVELLCARPEPRGAGILVLHATQEPGTATLGTVQEAMHALRGPGWKGSELANAICGCLGFEAGSSHDWLLMSHQVLMSPQPEWIPPESVLRGLAGGWRSSGEWKSSDIGPPSSGDLVREPGPFRHRSMTATSQGLAQVLVSCGDARELRRAENLGVLYSSIYLDIVLLHLRIHLRLRQIERMIASLEDPALHAHAVDALGAAARSLRASMWTLRPSSWAIANRAFKALQLELEIPSRLETLRIDMADFETALDRRHRSRVDGLLLVIALVSVVASVATITGVALTYWAVARPGDVDVEVFTGWWIAAPAAAFTGVVGYQAGLRRRKRAPVTDAWAPELA